VSHWRTGRSISLNVYEGNRPVCQCHNEEDAARIVTAVNREAEAIVTAKVLERRFLDWMQERAPETLKTWRAAYEREEKRA
jgi:hypothetical protein